MTRHVTSPRVDSGHSHAPRVLDPRLRRDCAKLYSPARIRLKTGESASSPLYCSPAQLHLSLVLAGVWSLQSPAGCSSCCCSCSCSHPRPGVDGAPLGRGDSDSVAWKHGEHRVRSRRGVSVPFSISWGPWAVLARGARPAGGGAGPRICEVAVYQGRFCFVLVKVQVNIHRHAGVSVAVHSDGHLGCLLAAEDGDEEDDHQDDEDQEDAADGAEAVLEHLAADM